MVSEYEAFRGRDFSWIEVNLAFFLKGVFWGWLLIIGGRACFFSCRVVWEVNGFVGIWDVNRETTSCRL